MDLTDTGWVKCHEELERSARMALYTTSLRGRFDVADIVQDGLLQIWQHKANEQAKPNTSWVRQIAHGHTIKNIRRHTSAKRDARRDCGVELPLLREADSPDVECLKRELVETVQTAINELEPLSRYIVNKHAVDGYPMTSVAASLGRSPRVCRRMLEKALLQLRITITKAIGHLTGELQQADR